MEQATFSLLCPSRARPERFRVMLESALRTAERPDAVTVELHIDSDDPRLPDYDRLASEFPDNARLIISDAKRPVPQIYDSAARVARGDILMLCADDLIFRTPGWDRMVRDTFSAWPDDLVLLYTNDGRTRDKAEHWFVSRRWVDVVGFFAWGGSCGDLGPFEHFCADTVAELIARQLDRAVFLEQVVTEHMHAKYGKSLNDATYREKRVRGTDGHTPSYRDMQRLALLRPEIDAAALRVRTAIEAGSCKNNAETVCLRSAADVTAYTSVRTETSTGNKNSNGRAAKAALTLVTSVNPVLFEQHGRHLVSTFETFAGPDVRLVVVFEGPNPSDGLTSRNVSFVPFKSAEHKRFLALFGKLHEANGLRLYWVNDSFNVKHDFRFDAVRYSHKIFAIDVARRALGSELPFAWIDADVRCLKTFSAADLDDFLPGPAQLMSYLGRTSAPFSECGFLGFNAAHPSFSKFWDRMRAIYLTGEIFSLREWHDSWVWDEVRREFEREGESFRNISGAAAETEHPFVNCGLGAFFDHLKGPARKRAGRSDSADYVLRHSPRN